MNHRNTVITSGVRETREDTGTFTFRHVRITKYTIPKENGQYKIKSIDFQVIGHR